MSKGLLLDVQGFMKNAYARQELKSFDGAPTVSILTFVYNTSPQISCILQQGQILPFMRLFLGAGMIWRMS